MTGLQHSTQDPAQGQQRAAEKDKAHRIVHPQPVSAPAGHIARLRAKPVAKREQEEQPDQPGAAEKAYQAIDGTAGQEQGGDVAAAVIQPFTQLPERDGGKQDSEEQNRFGTVMPLRLPPLAAEAPQIKQHGQQCRQPDAGKGGKSEEFDNARHHFAVRKQAADGDNDAGECRPEGVAAQPLPVHGHALKRTGQPLMVVSG